MTTIEAVYENGVLRPVVPVDLAEGARVSLIVVDTAQRPANGTAGHRRTPAEIMAAIAAMPSQSGRFVETGSINHDTILYGGEDAR